MTEEQLIRAAILDVIDGDSYELYEADYFNGRTIREDEANNERLNFCDAVVARIQQLRQMDDAAEANHPR